MNAKSKLQRGFTLVELMIVVAIVGVLAALAIYGVRKYIANSKTAEARNSLGQIAKDAGTAFQRENMAGAVLSASGTAQVSNRLCPDGAPVPGTVPAAAKFQTAPGDWNAAGWSCLKFSMTDPQYYQYEYDATGTGANGDGYRAIARGDLDGDTATSTFILAGRVQGGELVAAPTVAETDPEE